MTAIGDRSSGYTLGGPGQTAHTYGYDDLNRLVSGSATGGEFPNFTSAWAFNAIGNMTNKAGHLQGFAPPGANSIRPHAPITTSNPAQASFGYDPNGNMTALQTADRRPQTEASASGLTCGGQRSAVRGQRSGTMPSEFQFQNQRRLDDTQAGRLYDFNARFFSPVLANFISPDSIVPNPANPQSLNRYAAMANNPLKFTDPTGHRACNDADDCEPPGGGSGSGGSGGSGSGGGGGGASGRAAPTLRRDIVTPRFLIVVARVAIRLNISPSLLAATMYGEINSRWLKDDIEDGAVDDVRKCRRVCDAIEWVGAQLGNQLIESDNSVGPAKIKPSAILDPDTTVQVFTANRIAVPASRSDAAIQALDFETSVTYAGAYLKGLADIRKGDSPGNGYRFFDLSFVDKQVIRVAYTEGLGRFRSSCGGSLTCYRTTTTIVPGGRGDEAGPWITEFQGIYGY